MSIPAVLSANEHQQSAILDLIRTAHTELKKAPLDAPDKSGNVFVPDLNILLHPCVNAWEAKAFFWNHFIEG
jgi:hypothetical protein